MLIQFKFTALSFEYYDGDLELLIGTVETGSNFGGLLWLSWHPIECPRFVGDFLFINFIRSEIKRVIENIRERWGI